MDRISVTNYLRLHPELKGSTEKDIVNVLKKAGLVAPSTYWRDCNSLAELLRRAWPEEAT